MEQKEIKEKFINLVNQGKIPVMFKIIVFENPRTNHELKLRRNFHSSMFNNQSLTFRYTERALMI